ncbi:MAG: tetratricopeptide repeat protein [Candidatus Eremiobacter antarcticus]|nr:tetratricopeptide repeat protein [Candidatus Eremiobacteraeota bacterium]
MLKLKAFSAAIICLLVLCTGIGMADAPAAMSAAEALYAVKDYARAVPAYQAIVAQDPKNGLAWYHLAVSLQNLHRFDEAEKDYNESLSAGFQPYSVFYRLAQLEAQNNRADKALDYLSKANDLSSLPPAQIEGDSNFASLHGNAKYAALVDKQQRAFHPCMYDPAYRALDFWVGDWNVKAQANTQVGQSHVDLILDKCVVFENWTDAYGGTGKSFTFYDATAKQWVQHWVDGMGSANDYLGGRDGNSILMIAKTVGPKGEPVLRRMRFTPLDGGRVRQYMDQSSDGGKTWAASFDGIYEPKAKTPM